MKRERYNIHCDSQSALDLSKNAMYHSRTKHIDVRYHWLRQAMEEQQFKLEKIHTDDNPADMMMKVVTGGKLQLCAELIGLECMFEECYKCFKFSYAATCLRLVDVMVNKIEKSKSSTPSTLRAFSCSVSTWLRSMRDVPLNEEVKINNPNVTTAVSILGLSNSLSR
ncbi:Spc97 / Spc98 family of spindle pole body (SBP) component [Striga hermonthica]|uniref:Spc97 / Spc98 family of spindle pole body (SBP) component n=1 Tax=Striga hermonthica TaxID=68872 RepID=A0A9N7N6N2_STRHE|nr:Spc97 / Spc98 family of spindle pole body (SBP) component [Striga hermonthica]